MPDLTSRMPRPRLGLLPLGHSYYWEQFPRLKERGLRLGEKLRERLEGIGEVVAADLVDTPEKSAADPDTSPAALVPARMLPILGAGQQLLRGAPVGIHHPQLAVPGGND